MRSLGILQIPVNRVIFSRGKVPAVALELPLEKDRLKMLNSLLVLAVSLVGVYYIAVNIIGG